MPQTKREGLFFTTIVCFLMVFSMSVYNLTLHQQLSLSNLSVGLLPGFVVAFLVDVLIVAAIAKKIAFSLPINPQKKIHMIMSVSTCMVIGMVLFMSMYGVLMQFGFTDNFWNLYAEAIVKNLVMALPLQLILVGPVCRFILKKMRAFGLLQETPTKK